MKQTSIFQLLNQARVLPVTQTVQQGTNDPGDMSLPGVYARNIMQESGNADENRTFVPYRTLPPTTDYVYGVDKEPLAKTDNSTMQAAPIGPVPNQTPIMRGWRPKRPPIQYKDLGMQLFTDQQGPGLESTIPQEREVVNTADARATMPFPTLPEPMQITPMPEGGKGIYLDAPDELHDEGTAMSGMGDSMTDAISALAKDVTSSIQAKYGTDPNAIKAAAVSQSTIPWGTLLTVGVLGAAAIYFIPKLTR